MISAAAQRPRRLRWEGQVLAQARADVTLLGGPSGAGLSAAKSPKDRPTRFMVLFQAHDQGRKCTRITIAMPTSKHAWPETELTHIQSAFDRLKQSTGACAHGAKPQQSTAGLQT